METMNTDAMANAKSYSKWNIQRLPCTTYEISKETIEQLTKILSVKRKASWKTGQQRNTGLISKLYVLNSDKIYEDKLRVLMEILQYKMLHSKIFRSSKT